MLNPALRDDLIAKGNTIVFNRVNRRVIMTPKALNAQKVAFEDEGRSAPTRELTLFEAITMSIVAILAVAVGTVYGTILF